MASLHNTANKTTVPAPNVGSVQYVISFLLASLCYILITQLTFFYILCMFVLCLFCSVYSMFLLSFLYCFVYCFSFCVVSFLFIFESTDQCHWVETQM
jgi:hypothetical protein